MSIYKVLAVLIAVVIYFAACKKDDNQVRLDPKLSTSQVINIKHDSATVVGFVVAAGDGVTEKGVCFSTQPGPTVANKVVVYMAPTATASFNVKIGGLNFATKYYARAYAVTHNGTIYGEEVNFTTLPVAPTVTTDFASVVTGNSATSGGMVTVTGGAAVTDQGIVYSLTANPTTATGTKISCGTTAGHFVAAITGLKGNKTYYIRAYATNSVGTAYGPQVSFATLIDLATVNTYAATLVDKTIATFNGEVTYDGGGTVSENGFVYGLNANPTVTDTKVAVGTGMGIITYNATGLAKNTTFHVRAYAINTVGTVYGADMSFKTKADINTFYIVGKYNNWTNDANAKTIISTATNPEAQGYIYFPAASLASNGDGFKFIANPGSWANATTYGDDGTNTGKLSNVNGGGNVTVPAAGFYLLKADPVAMTYSLTLTNWGIIGNATVGGWGAQTDMTFDPATSLYSIYSHLTQKAPPNDGMKFRGTSDWAVNYGSSTADNNLDAGGTNIGVAYEADYYIVLDLTHPNAYTFTKTSWGVIGDATPGGWSTDSDMSWDAVNQVWTTTIALVSSSGAKSFKFRASHDWGTNFGGNGSGDGTADNYTNATTAPVSAGGHNLGVPGNVDGTYKITLDTKNKIATVVKQ